VSPSIGLRPNFTPRRCAALTPARLRSVIRLRSSSAGTPTLNRTPFAIGERALEGKLWLDRYRRQSLTTSGC
jgi:hypothetical protein